MESCAHAVERIARLAVFFCGAQDGTAHPPESPLNRSGEQVPLRAEQRKQIRLGHTRPQGDDRGWSGIETAQGELVDGCINDRVPALGSREPNAGRTFSVGGVHHEPPPLNRGPVLPVSAMTSTLGASLLGRRQSSGRFRLSAKRKRPQGVIRRSAESQGKGSGNANGR